MQRLEHGHLQRVEPVHLAWEAVQSVVPCHWMPEAAWAPEHSSDQIHNNNIYNYKKNNNTNNNKKSHSNNKYINVNACQCFPAHDELGKCRASLVSPEPVLCIPIFPRLMNYRLDPGRTLSKNYRYTFSPVLWFWSHFQLSVVLLTLFCSAAAMCTIVWLRLKRFILLRLVCS